jgi:hypothetical protein
MGGGQAGFRLNVWLEGRQSFAWMYGRRPGRVLHGCMAGGEAGFWLDVWLEVGRYLPDERNRCVAGWRAGFALFKETDAWLEIKRGLP